MYWYCIFWSTDLHVKQPKEARLRFHLELQLFAPTKCLLLSFLLWLTPLLRSTLIEYEFAITVTTTMQAENSSSVNLYPNVFFPQQNSSAALQPYLRYGLPDPADQYNPLQNRNTTPFISRHSPTQDVYGLDCPRTNGLQAHDLYQAPLQQQSYFGHQHQPHSDLLFYPLPQRHYLQRLHPRVHGWSPPSPFQLETIPMHQSTPTNVPIPTQYSQNYFSSPSFSSSSIPQVPQHPSIQNDVGRIGNQVPQKTSSNSPHIQMGILYRSPKQLRLRTAHACEKCRLRKSKCSGERPCARCKQRGLVCEYSKEGRVRGPNKPKIKALLDPPSAVSSKIQIENRIQTSQNESQETQTQDTRNKHDDISQRTAYPRSPNLVESVSNHSRLETAAAEALRGLASNIPQSAVPQDLQATGEKMIYDQQKGSRRMHSAMGGQRRDNRPSEGPTSRLISSNPPSAKTLDLTFRPSITSQSSSSMPTHTRVLSINSLSTAAASASPVRTNSEHKIGSPLSTRSSAALLHPANSSECDLLQEFVENGNRAPVPHGMTAPLDLDTAGMGGWPRGVVGGGLENRCRMGALLRM